MEGNTNFKYARIFPRDLFNEAKLLKCLGQLVLLIHDDKAPRLRFYETGESVQIGLHDAGYLTPGRGLRIECDGKPIWLGIPYNSRENYPLIVMLDNWEELEVFNNAGLFTADFEEYVRLDS